MSDVMIEARELSKRYGQFRALQNASFEVKKQEVVGFLGPNGAGKTTTMKILTCFIAPSEGTARINGADIFDDSIAVRRSIGYLPESTPLYTDMLVYEYLEFIAKMRELDDARAAIRRVVEQAGLGDVVGQEIRSLSKGYRQRVGLAQALIHEPPVLILDEPLSGLDPNQAVEIRDLIREIGRERTVILSTHNLAEVQVTCSRVLIIAKGRLVADDRPEELRARAGKARYQVEFLRQGEQTEQSAKTALENITGIASVQRKASDEADLLFEIVPDGDEDLRADVFNAAVKANLVMVGLERQGENLEDVFRQLTTAGNDEPGAREGASGQESSPTQTKAEAGGDDDRGDDDNADPPARQQDRV